MSNLQDRTEVNDQLMRDTLKTTREREKWIQQLPDDSKRTNRRTIGINEKSEDTTKGIKNLLTQVITENFPDKEK